MWWGGPHADGGGATVFVAGAVTIAKRARAPFAPTVLDREAVSVSMAEFADAVCHARRPIFLASEIGLSADGGSDRAPAGTITDVLAGTGIMPERPRPPSALSDLAFAATAATVRLAMDGLAISSQASRNSWAGRSRAALNQRISLGDQPMTGAKLRLILPSPS